MILACDAGFKNTGCAVIGPGGRIHALWVLKTRRTSGKKRAFYIIDEDTGRCADIAKMMKATIERYKIRVMVCELPTGGALGARAMRCMSLSTGVMIACAELLRLPTIWVTPLQVKSVAGRMNATKDQIITTVLQKIPALENHPAWLAIPREGREHAADALAAFLFSQRHPLVLSIMNEPNLAQSMELAMTTPQTLGEGNNEPV